VTINAPLADALRDATPEQLREDAEALAAFAAREAYPEGDRMGIARGPLRRAAALALAVATMQEREDVTLHKWGTVVWLDAGATVNADNIPAALAALLEDA
jgi:hypothetical protein